MMLPYLIRRAIKQWWLVAPRMVLKWSWNARFWREADLRHVVLDPACGPKAATRQAQSLQQASTYS
jgi:hypothetical protein